VEHHSWKIKMSAPSPANPLLLSKLRIPRARPEIVARPRIAALLDSAAQRKLTLLCAPPGAGKTTALSEWAQHCSAPIAWLTLADSDNLLEDFLSYLAAALERAVPGCSASAMSLLHAPAPLDEKAFTAALLNDLDALTAPLILVLDDFHLLHNQIAQAVVNELVEHMPPAFHLVIATRSDPPLPLARLRARGELTELRAADLRFTTQEAAAFLNEVMHLGLAPQEVEALESRTEGWIAGLQLAALSMRGRKDVASFIRAFTGSHRFVLDYLVEEVLIRQPEPVQSFLLQTSILDRLCGALCDAILAAQEEKPDERAVGDPSRATPAADEAPSNSQSILTDLERSNLFIEPLDDERRWFRYHRLFADLLRYRLEQSYPVEHIRRLHLRAAVWLERHDLLEEAISHYIAGGDDESAARLVSTRNQEWLKLGQANRLIGWLDSLPARLREVNPSLHLHMCWAMISTGRFQQMEAHLRAAEEGFERLRAAGRLSEDEIKEFRLDLISSRAILASTQGDLDAVITFSEEALSGLPEDNPWRATIGMGLAVAHLWKGNIRLADEALLETIRAGKRYQLGSIYLAALANHADMTVEQGRLHEAYDIYQDVVRESTQPNGGLSPLACLGYIGMANLHAEWGEAEKALELVMRGQELAEQWGNADIRLLTYGTLARVRALLNDEAGAMAAVEAASGLVSGPPQNPLTRSVFEAVRLHVWMNLGHLKRALEWLDAHPVAPENRPALVYPDEYLARARASLLRGETERIPSLLAALERMEGEVREAGRNRCALDMLALQAAAWWALGRKTEALTTLRRALGEAQAEGYLRLFADKGALLAAPLRELAAIGPLSAYAMRILEAMVERAEIAVGEKHRPNFPALSERELEVLRLVASGLGNRAIAERLVLSPGTVKRHLHNIMEKLDAANRTEAVARARALELL
jgi:LuxR family maltose regulon positive regulatory protein